MISAEQGTVQTPTARNSRLRGLSLLLALVVVIAFVVAIMRGRSASQDAELQRMSAVELETRIKNEPDNSAARYRLGLAYMRENRLPDATKTLLAVIESQKEPTPQTADVLNDLGVLYLLQERYYESLVSLQQSLELRPNFSAAIANMGRLHLATKMPFTATKELQKAAELDAKNVTILCDLGEAHQQTLNHDAAAKVYQKALKLEPRSVPAHLGLGKVYYSEGKNELATQSLNEVLKLAPDSAPALLTLARMGIETAQTPEQLQAAADKIQTALKIDPQSSDGWYDLGKIALRRNQHKDAIEHLKKALALAPMHNGALHQIERALRADGRTTEADRTKKVLAERLLRDREELRLEEHVEHHPNDWDAQGKLAEIYVLAGKRGLAMLLHQRLLQNDPNNTALPALNKALGQQAAPPSSSPTGTKEP